MYMEVCYRNSLLLGVHFEVIWSLLVWVHFHCDRRDRGETVVEENGLYVVPYPEVSLVVEVSQSFYFSDPRFGRHILDRS